jgi:hypothetical protein
MENLPARVPHTLFPDLVSAFVPPDAPRDAVLELVITSEGKNFPAREYAEYLSLIDRLYGRLSREGLMSYSHSERGRLQIAEINKGSLETVFHFFSEHADRAIVLFLVVKYLPTWIKLSAEAYKAYEEGKLVGEQRAHLEVVNRYDESQLARENRKRVRAQLHEETAIANLDVPRRSQLTTLLVELLTEENPRLSTPIRFARHQVRNVMLRIRDRSNLK